MYSTLEHIERVTSSTVPNEGLQAERSSVTLYKWQAWFRLSPLGSPFVWRCCRGGKATHLRHAVWKLTTEVRVRHSILKYLSFFTFSPCTRHNYIPTLIHSDSHYPHLYVACLFTYLYVYSSADPRFQNTGFFKKGKGGLPRLYFSLRLYAPHCLYAIPQLYAILCLYPI